MPAKHVDPFSKYMQDRLKEHSVRPDDACWDEIEAKMRRGRKISLRKAGGAVAAVILAVLLLQLLQQQPTHPLQEEWVAEEKESRPPIRSGQQAPILPKEEPAPGERTVQVISERIVIPAAPEEEREAEEETEGTTAAEAKPEKESSPPEEKEETRPVYYPPVHGRNSPVMQQKKNNNWLVAAAFGTGSGINPSLHERNKNYQNDGNFWGSPEPGLKPPLIGNEFTDQHIPEAYSEADYRIPFSVGITVRKNVHKYMAVESGLVYTYLSSRFKENRSEARYEAKSELHYLGIPLNVVGNLYRNSSWNVYISGGIMAEKGLRSVTSFNKITVGGTESSTERSPIKRIQWSINGAVGVSYRLFNEWSIYAEPRLSYYFDSGQPPSIRTDKPVTFGIAGGIRYAF